MIRIKKSASDLVKKKRDVALLSQLFELFTALLNPAYVALEGRLHTDNYGWAAGWDCSDAAFCSGAALAQAHMLKHEFVLLLL